MKISMPFLTIALTSTLISQSFAAETTWTLNCDLPEKKGDVKLGDYIPIIEMKSNSTDCALAEIMVEVLPASTLTARNFGILAPETLNYRMPEKICVNFIPTMQGISCGLKAFIKSNFGGEGNIFSCHNEYTWTNFYIHKNTCQYACVSFSLRNYKRVKMVFDELAALANLSETDRGLLSKAYAEIEMCATKQS